MFLPFGLYQLLVSLIRVKEQVSDQRSTFCSNCLLKKRRPPHMTNIKNFSILKIFLNIFLIIWNRFLQSMINLYQVLHICILVYRLFKLSSMSYYSFLVFVHSLCSRYKCGINCRSGNVRNVRNSHFMSLYSNYLLLHKLFFIQLFYIYVITKQ